MGKRQVRMDLMSSKDVHEYQKKNDLVILPVGCFEFHGPELPLACDTFVAWAASQVLAERWKCVTLPPMNYSYPGASGPWPGSVEISIEATQVYLESIIRALLKGGFKRVVICGVHAPLRFMVECVLRDIFQKSGDIVFFLQPFGKADECFRKELGYGLGEDALLLGALKILGLNGAYVPRTKVTKKTSAPFESAKKLREAGASFPWSFSRDYQHAGLRKEVRLKHADGAARAIKKALARLDDLPKLMTRFRKDLQKLHKQKPWLKDSIWTPLE